MRRKRLMERVAEKLGLDEKRLIKSFDVIGDIVVVKIPDELLDLRFRIGESILEELKNVKVVFRQVSEISGEFRLRKLEWIAGEKRSITTHREHGCRYLVNVEKVYFSPRLSNERLRIAKLVKDGETIINMFAGVGPFSILIAKLNRNVKVYSIDLNPEAVKLHVENCKLNKVLDRVKVIQGDSRIILKKDLRGLADRVLMPLPEIALDSLESATHGLKNVGWLHIYVHVPYKFRVEEALSESLRIVHGRLMDLGVNVIDFRAVRVREVATRILQVCVDVFVKKRA